MNRQLAEKELKRLFGFDNFHDEQWETIDLLLQGRRVLLIEKTGFGKSLCYQFPATQFEGLTIIFSPLIALMRDQVNTLNRKGIAARLINSEQTEEENEQVLEEAKNGDVKILYIAPERQENQQWLEAVRSMNISMVVIDEAHTISIWGHDFRPSFRRIVNLVKQLPENFPVLATTATATERVQQDIEKQISGNITTIRGKLVRDNFELYAIKVNSEDEKMLWLAEHIHDLEGTGLIYTGTRTDTEIYAKWLEHMGVSSTMYNAGLDAASRKDIEEGLMQNRWKAIVSTNALGMGIDKPDIRFIIHTQTPQSPIHYYQEIGRAGRDGKPAKLILLYNDTETKGGLTEDQKLPMAFINGARPGKDKYELVIEKLKEEPLGLRNLQKATNLKQTPVKVILEDLVDQGIVKVAHYGTKYYEYQYGAPELNTKPFTALRLQKLGELDKMIGYINHSGSRMAYLCDYLGDRTNGHTGNCDNTTLDKFEINPDEETIADLQNFRDNYFPVLNVETKHSNLVNGVAASYYGVSSVGAALHRSKYEDGGPFPDFLLKMTLKAIRRTFGKETFDLILYVPPTESGRLVQEFAEKLGNTLKIPVSDDLVKTEGTSPQKVFQNGVLKRENVANKFDIRDKNCIFGRSVLLIDDICDSGCTIKEIGKLLTNLGAKKITPVVIAKTVSGDI